MCEYLFNSFTGKRENKSVGPFKVRGLNMEKTEKDLLWFMQLRKTKTVSKCRVITVKKKLLTVILQDTIKLEE